jgi:hypothetical protein
MAGSEGRVPGFVRLHHGVGGALDAALHAQRAQQVAHQRGLAGAQVAVQVMKALASAAARPAPRAKAAVSSSLRQVSTRAVSRGLSGRGFYNRPICGSSQLVPQLREWARELGFSQIGVAGVDLSAPSPGLMQWLAQGFHGDMHYMAARTA